MHVYFCNIRTSSLQPLSQLRYLNGENWYNDIKCRFTAQMGKWTKDSLLKPDLGLNTRTYSRSHASVYRPLVLWFRFSCPNTCNVRK